MDGKRSQMLLIVFALSALAASFAFMALRSSDLATAIFLLVYVAALFVVSPFVGLLVYIVFNYWPPQSFLPALVSFRIMLITGGGTFLVMIFRQVAGRERSYWFKSPQDFFVVWFALAVMISHVVQGDLAFAGRAMWGFAPVMILYFLAVNLVDAPKRLNAVLAVIALCTIGLAIRAVYQHLTGTAMVEIGEITAERAFGAGRFENPNMLAIGILCAMPFTYLKGRRGEGNVGKAFWFSATVLLGIGLYLTNSRGGILSFAAVAGLYFVGRHGVWKGVLAGAVLAAAAIVFGPSRMTTISTEEASAFQRLVTWDEGIRHFLTSPLFGVGAGAWGEKFRTMIAHNSFIHCAAEVGLFGLIPWVIAVYVSIRNTKFVVSDDAHSMGPLERTNFEALYYGIVGFAVASVFISKTYHPLLFLLVGLAAAATRMFAASDDRHFVMFDRTDALVAVAVTVGGLVLFKVFLLLAGF
jgi:O-antigen ligase